MTNNARVIRVPLPEPDLEDHEYELWGQNVRGYFFSLEAAAARGRAFSAQIAAEKRIRDAAPQMLAALQTLVDVIKRETVITPLAAQIDDAVAQAETAIAAATTIPRTPERL